MNYQFEGEGVADLFSYITEESKDFAFFMSCHWQKINLGENWTLSLKWVVYHSDNS